MKVNPEAINILNKCLDRMRYRNELPNDQELAKYLGVSTKTISFFRNGHWTPVDRALINVLVDGQETK